MRLLGRRPAKSTPTRDGSFNNKGAESPLTTPTRKSPASKSPASSPKVHASSGGGGWCSRQSIMMLAVGILTGYVILPIMLIERSFEDMYVPPKSANDMPNNGMAEGAPSGGTRGGSVDHLPASLGRTLAADGDAVLQRLMEDRDIMSHQSMPTSTTPRVMKTKTLPDHHRKKVLVTGGAGFVGSHLVDKLMMAGHEVIAMDNFFTGQKKNVAHWLHHPNFRYVCFFVVH